MNIYRTAFPTSLMMFIIFFMTIVDFSHRRTTIKCQVNSKEEAIEWTKRFPNPAVDGREGEIEVRQLFELDDFDPSEAVERFRRLGVGVKH
jgi:hypothetical protein